MSKRPCRGEWCAMLALACLCAVMMLASGCPATTPQCTTDADCDVGQVCNDSGVCEAGTGTTCTADADCNDGLFCNGTETCVETACQAGSAPCLAGQTCDEEGEVCVGEESPFETNVFLDEFDRVHGLHRTAFPTCTVCHHDEPVSAGFGRCSECHSLDPAELNSYKDIAHDQNESGDGCRMCHDDERNDDDTWNCSFCHTLLSEL